MSVLDRELTTTEATPPPRVVSPARAEDARRTLLVGLGALLGFAPLRAVFSDWSWMTESVGAVMIVIGPAAYLRLRRPPRALQLVPGLVALIFYTTALYLHDSATAVFIPTLDTWHQLGELGTQARTIINDSSTPLASTPALRVGVVPALAVAAALIDWTTVVRRAPALAGVGLLAIFTTCGAVTASSVGWFPFAVAASGFLVLLSADSRANLLRWGRVVPRRKGDHSGGVQLGLSGRRIGIIAVATAVIVPSLIPGLSRNLLAEAIHGSSGGGGSGAGTSISPFASLKGQLTVGKTISLATVHVDGASDTDEPYYLKSKVLDTFTESGWKASGTRPGEPATQFNLAQSLPRVTSTNFKATVTVDQLSDTAPIFANPASLAFLGSARSWHWDPVDQTLVGDTTRRGDVYAEQVQQPAPTVAQLEAANSSATDPAQSQYLAVPPDLPVSVSDLVVQLTAGKTGDYARALALANYFLDPANGFVYSLQTSAGDSGNDLVDFLTNKIGYCQQYAASLGVMLRLAHIPARVVVGYTHSAPNAAGDFTITNRDAHAWTEAYFADIGWIPFDATPLIGANAGRAVGTPWQPRPTDSSTSTGVTSDVPTQRAPSRANTGASRQQSLAAGTSSRGGSVRLPGWVLPLLGAFVAVFLLLLVVPGARSWRRHRRFRAALGTGRLEPLWEELQATAIDVGAGWGSSTTPRQVPAWLTARGVPSARLDPVARQVERERYDRASAVAVATPGVNDAIDSVRTTIRGLLSRQARGTRLRTLLWPRSLTAPIRRRLTRR